MLFQLIFKKTSDFLKKPYFQAQKTHFNIKKKIKISIIKLAKSPSI